MEFFDAIEAGFGCVMSFLGILIGMALAVAVVGVGMFLMARVLHFIF